MYLLVFLYAQKMMKLFLVTFHQMDVWCGYLSFSTWNGWFVVELSGRGTRVCWLCCTLWLIIVTKYKDTRTYTVIICIPMFWNNYQYHLPGSSSPRNVCIYQSVPCYMPEEWRSHLQCSRILKSWITVSVVIFQSWNLYSYQKE